jgi:hypothetical protein
MSEFNFLEIHKNSMENLGFWEETYKKSVIQMIENGYKTEVIREWSISDLSINGDKILIKWAKRYRPLTKEELKEKYGR